jgi:homoserine trans-succinylase
MPIILPKKLPSATLLRNNGIELRRQSAPNSPTLRVSLLNLMTEKNPSETQAAGSDATTPADQGQSE